MKTFTKEELEDFETRYPTTGARILSVIFQIAGLAFWLFVAYIFFRLT